MGCLQYQLVLTGFLNHQLSLRTNDLSIQVSPITNPFFLVEWPRFELDFMIFHGMRLQYGDNVGGWFWFQGIYIQLPIVQIDWV